MTVKYITPGDIKSAHNFRCVRCNLVYKTPQGLCAHLRKVHKIKIIKPSRDWKLTKRCADWRGKNAN